MQLALKLNQLIWAAARGRRNDEMIRLWVHTKYSQFPSVGYFTYIITEHWVQGTLLLYVTCDWQSCWYLLMKVSGKLWVPQPGVDRTFSAAGEWLNHWTTLLYSATHKISADVLRCIHLLYIQLYYAANPHCFALLKVVEVIATEEGHQHLKNVMGCIVCFSWFATCETPFTGIELFCSTQHMHMQIFISDVHLQCIKTSIKPITVMLQQLLVW